eukprot:scaffold11242_cov106-Cylindrotheca_fusiformis.AAC.4
MIKQHHGEWEGQYTRWNGCICGNVHPHPVEVFWIQCDGPCQAWHNVRPECVGIDSVDAERLENWYCQVCYQKQRDSPVLCAFLKLPEHLIYNILDFAASGATKVHVINILSVTSKFLNHTVENRPWDGVWGILFRRDFASKEVLQGRSKRAKRHHNAHALSSYKARVEALYISMCQRTEDAHMSLLSMLDSRQTPLSVVRLRRHMADGVLINRRSQAGRTFLHECCTADYVDARVVLQCVRELVNVYGADPNMFTKGESDGDRPPLFFAISRLMPTVVAALLDAGASIHLKVKGHFRLVSDPSMTISGIYTPLEFALKLQEAERSQQRPKGLSFYWTKRLHECVKVLSIEAKKTSTSNVL